MKIKSRSYQIFYEVLREVFIKIEHKSVLPTKARGISSPIVWEIQDASGNYLSLERFGGGATQDSKYFYRLHGKLKVGVVNEGEVDDLALVKALKYIGISLPVNDNEPKKILSLKDEAESLFKIFERQYVPENSVGGKANVISTKLSPSNLVQTHDVQTLPDQNSDFEIVKGIINAFFKYISVRNFPEAWKLLTSNIRYRVYQNDFDLFELAYLNTRGIRNLLISDVRKTAETKIDCVIDYEDEIDAYTSMNLDSFRSMTAKNIDEFVRVIKKMEEEVLNLGGKNFDKIELHKFFEPAASEQIWFKCKIPPERISEIFPSKKTIFIVRRFHCTCDLIGSSWLIERIIPLPNSHS